MLPVVLQILVPTVVLCLVLTVVLQPIVLTVVLQFLVPGFQKQTDKLIATLKVADVRKALDRNSEQKTSKNRATVHHSGTLFGWHDLFKVRG